MKDINLLHLIRNSVYCRQVVFPAMWSLYLEKIPEVYVDDLEVEAMDLKTVHIQLEFAITQEYIRRKSNQVFRLISNGVLHSGNLFMQDWKAGFQNVVEIRSYVEEVLMEMVGVHQELSACGVDKDRSTRILNALTDQLFVSFFKCLQEVENMSPAYSLQLLGEFDFISTVLNKNLSEASKGLYVKAVSFMEEICEEDTQELRDGIVEKAIEQTCLVFKCFGIKASQKLAEVHKDDETKDDLI
jgi:hypothetical protein